MLWWAVYLLMLTATATFVGSCQPYHAVHRDGKYKTVIRSKKFSGLLIPHRIVGKSTTTDTVENRVVERRYYRTITGPFRSRNITRTITYDHNERKSKEVIVENGKRTTIEYVRN